MASAELPIAHVATCDGIHDLPGEVVGISQAVDILEDSVAKVRKQRNAFNSMLDVVRDGQQQLQQVLELRSKGGLPQAIETHYLLLACELKHAVLDCLHVAMRGSGTKGRGFPLAGLLSKYNGGTKITEAEQAEELLTYLQLITGYINKGPPPGLVAEALAEETLEPSNTDVLADTSTDGQQGGLLATYDAPRPPPSVSFSSSSATTLSGPIPSSLDASSELSSAVALAIISSSTRDLQAGSSSSSRGTPYAEPTSGAPPATQGFSTTFTPQPPEFTNVALPRPTQLTSPFTSPTQLTSPFTSPTQLTSPFTTPGERAVSIPAAPGRPPLVNPPPPVLQPLARTSPFLNQVTQLPDIMVVPGRPPPLDPIDSPRRTLPPTTQPPENTGTFSNQPAQDPGIPSAASPLAPLQDTTTLTSPSEVSPVPLAPNPTKPCNGTVPQEGKESVPSRAEEDNNIKQAGLQQLVSKSPSKLAPYPTLSIQDDPPTPGHTLPSQASRVSNHRCIEGRGEKLNAMLLTRIPGDGTDSQYIIMAAVKKELTRHNVQTMIPLVQTLSSEILSIAQSEDGTSWLGLKNGTVQIENRGVKLVHSAFLGSGVSSVAVGQDGAAWVGGENGELKVLELDRVEGSVVELTCEGGVNKDAVMLPSPPTPKEFNCCGVQITVQSPAGTSSKSASTKAVTVIRRVGRHMVVSMGTGETAKVQLWNNNREKRALQDVFVCGSFSTCTCITSLPWDTSKSNSKTSSTGTTRERILTGHAKGAVLLWNDHELGRLSPLIMIGKPVAGGIRGLAACPSLGVLCVGLSKAFNVCQLPTPLDLENININSDASLDQSSIPYWSPVAAQVPAHRSGIRLLTGAHDHIITGSTAGTVRIWPLHGILTVMRRVGMDQEVKTEVPDKLMRQLTNSQQVIKASELHMMMQIGRGAYGEVYLALWKGIRVAVKKTLMTQGPQYHDWDSEDGKGDHNSNSGNRNHTDSAGGNLAGGDNSQLSRAAGGSSVQEQQRELLREVQNLASLAHVNVMRLLGVVLDERTGMCSMIVTEYYPRGSVFDLIKKAAAGKMPLPWLRRLQILRDVAAGMHYLHDKKPLAIVHGDLRSPNLLVDLGWVVKIADFGSARMLLEANGGVPISKASNPRWCPPEKLVTNKDSPAADVYSFAIVMWELLTFRLPFDHLVNEFAVYNEVLRGARPELHVGGQGGPSAPEGYVELMGRCWAQQPEDRPQFLEVLEVVQGMVKREGASRLGEVRGNQ